MATVTHPVLSAAEFAAVMDDHGWAAPVELIAGEVVFVTPTGGSASFAQVEIAHALRARGDGRVLTDVFVRIADSFLGPDVAWWRPGREPEIGPGAIDSIPDLVIEVLSPATRANDLGPKRRTYVEGGVTELWLVDPAERTVLIVDRAGERVLVNDATLPGLALAVSALFPPAR
jgi:Uma2 family endonuclease